MLLEDNNPNNRNNLQTFEIPHFIIEIKYGSAALQLLLTKNEDNPEVKSEQNRSIMRKRYPQKRVFVDSKLSVRYFRPVIPSLYSSKQNTRFPSRNLNDLAIYR